MIVEVEGGKGGLKMGGCAAEVSAAYVFPPLLIFVPVWQRREKKERRRKEEDPAALAVSSD